MAKNKKEFPTKFPFWARYIKNKNRTTLVIDEERVKCKNSDKYEDCYVHRESTHSYRKDFEKIDPNPDKDDKRPMYLKRPTKKSKNLFIVHNKKLYMPQHLIDRYNKNNKK